MKDCHAKNNDDVRYQVQEILAAYQVRIYFASHLISKNVNIKMYKTNFACCFSEVCSVSLCLIYLTFSYLCNCRDSS
jgi:hypothetical protein